MRKAREQVVRHPDESEDENQRAAEPVEKQPKRGRGRPRGSKKGKSQLEETILDEDYEQPRHAHTMKGSTSRAQGDDQQETKSETEDEGEAEGSESVAEAAVPVAQLSEPPVEDEAGDVINDQGSRKRRRATEPETTRDDKGTRTPHANQKRKKKKNCKIVDSC